MKIHKKTILPGQSKQIKIPVGRLPSNTQIAINTFVFRSENEGPTCQILAGVHGDEINGVEIVRRALKEGIFNKIKKGTVIAIPSVSYTHLTLPTTPYV